MYTIKESDGNYVSEMSFSKHNSEGTQWVYSTFAGRCSAMRYFPNIDSTYDTIIDLTEKSQKLRLHKKYEPVLVHIDQLQWVNPTRRIVTIS